MKRVLLPLAPGFEEIEAVTIVDVLRRAGIEVVVAGLPGSSGAGVAEGGGPVEGSRGIHVTPDLPLAQVDPAGFEAIVLPGGLGGTEAMIADGGLLAIVREHHGRGKLLGAICAAPMVLAAAGVAAGHELTSHPSVRGRLGDAVVRDAPRVVRSGHVITSQGPGTAMEFALALVEELVGGEAREDLAGAMVVAT